MNNSHQGNGGGRVRSILERSGLVTALIVAVVLGVLGLIWSAHLHGRIHRLTNVAPTPETPPPARPGGQDIVHLDRIERADAMTPEFTSATMLPGVGMQVLQAKLQLPGEEEVPLLLGTPEIDLGKVKGQPTGSPFSVLVQSREGGHWTQPREVVAGAAAQQASTNILPDGSSEDAQFSETDASSKPPVHTGVETKLSTMVSSRGLDLMMSAKNTSDSPRGITLSWRANLLAPKGGLQAFTVEPPRTEATASTNPGHNSDNLPGLSAANIDRTFAGLRHSYLSTGPELRLHNKTDGYILHFTVLTPSIRSMRAKAADDGKSLMLVFSTAMSDSPDGARTEVAPGETLQWRVRLEATLDSVYTPSQN